MLLILSPFICFAFILIKLTSKGPFIFKQKRIGKNSKVFTIFKIRTMIEDAEIRKKEVLHLNEADGPVFKIKNDPRYTKIGKLLAYTGLDEILQLINIIKGEMSFVGPRPLPVEEAMKVPKIYHERFQIKPGITSLWVIRRINDISFKKWMESDLEYIQRKNLLLDLFIIITTIFLMVKWSSENIFLIIFPLILLFYAAFPDSLWWIQIFTFLTIILFLSVDFSRRPSHLFLFLIILFFISTFYSISRINSVPVFISYSLIFFLSSVFQEKYKQILIKSFITVAVSAGLITLIYLFSKVFLDNTTSYFAFLPITNLFIPNFGHAMYGVFVVTVLPFVLEKISLRNNSSLWRLTFVFLILSMLLSLSKATILLSLSEIILFFIFSKEKKILFESIKNLVLPLAFIFSITLFIFVGRSSWLKEKVIKQSLAPRMEYWQQGMKVIQNSPVDRILLGYGFDSFYAFSSKYQSRPNYWAKYPHNLILQFIIENGAIAAFVYLLYIAKTYKDNFNRYSLSEKIILPSLFIYSFGASADLTAFPILLLFFILLQKHKESDDIKQSQKLKIIYSVFSLLLFISWSGYIYIYSRSYIFRDITTANIAVFPYDADSWGSLIIKNRKNISVLKDIKVELKKYSSLNLEMDKLFLLYAFDNNDFCQALELSTSYILKVPFDTSIQETIMNSYDKCDEERIKDINTIFRQIESGFKDDNNPLDQRKFLQFAAIYYLKLKDFNEYESWFDKAWRLKTENETSEWHEEVFNLPVLAIPMPDKFKMKLTLETIGALSGIGLNGSFAKSGEPWWKSPKILVGYTDNGNELYINIQDGKTEKPIVLVNRHLEIKNDPVIIQLENKGTILSVINEKGQIIERVDMNQITRNLLPNGIFPDGNIYLGYGVSPQSSLIIKQLSLTPTE